MGWWKPPAWVSDLAGWWRAVQEVDPAIKPPVVESAPKSDLPATRDVVEAPTTFVEVLPLVTPTSLDGARGGKWERVLTCRACGWLPRVPRDDREMRSPHTVFPWEPCPACGESGKLVEVTARGWVHGTRSWWEIRTPR